MSKLNEKFDLNIFKARNVKTPEKFGAAAGWDFFIPNDLNIFDFVNNITPYVNEYLDIKLTNNYYTIPLEFNIKIDNKIISYVIKCLKLNDEWKPSIYRLYKANMPEFFQGPVVDNDEFEKLLITPLESIKILPGSKVLIPSGIHIKLPENVFLVAENKSGIASKRGLVRGACLIDYDYEGQVHINLINSTNTATYIKPGEKIIQFVAYFQPIMSTVKEWTSKEELYKDRESIRGEGGFGSSGV